jgi:hypothetical protein
MIRPFLAPSLTIALLGLIATPAAAKCLPLGKTVEMVGQVFAFEAFDETEADTVRRLRDIDYYAMLLPERVCAGKGGATLHNLTIVGLKGDAAVFAPFARTPVRVTGKLKRGPVDADPQVVLTVRTVQALKVE